MAVALPSVVKKLYLLVRCFILVAPWLLHLFLADILLSALLPVSFLFPTFANNISSKIAESVWRGIQLIFTRINRANIVVSGADALPKGETAIVVSNHVEWSDFYMIQELAIRKGMLARNRWFAKQQLKWVPFLGWGLWAMGMPLVSRKWMSDQREMNRVFHGVLTRQWPMWLISYSEATRFTRAKQAEAQQWCKAHDKVMPLHTLYPRTKGFIASVQKLREAPHVQAVYDVTIAYAHGKHFQEPPSFLQTLVGPRLDRNRRFFVHVERHALKTLPHADTELAQWLEDRWVEKGTRLERLRALLEHDLPWTDDVFAKGSKKLE